jgi:hypothetical protein
MKRVAWRRETSFRALSLRYSEARRIERIRILDEFVAVPGIIAGMRCGFCVVGLTTAQ